jgi:hypothetical protein
MILAHEIRAPVCKFEFFPFGRFRNQSPEATVVFTPQFLSRKNEYFCLQDFLETKVFILGAPKLYHNARRFVNRDKPLCCIFAHLNFFGFFVYNRIHDDKGSNND